MNAAEVRSAAVSARAASREVAGAGAEVKNAVLRRIADDLRRNSAGALAANAKDLDAARAAGLSGPKLARLGLDARSVERLAVGLEQIAALPDPVGSVIKESTTADGLHIRKVRTPIGVIAMIYEARPGVTLDAFALCFKAGNACILKGGKEARHSNAFLAGLIHDALSAHGLPAGAATIVSDLERDRLGELLTLDTLIDLVIPRGGVELIRFVHQHSRIPTIQHFEGVCHIFVDRSADPARAAELCVSAKVSAPATCNAAECLLVHREIAGAFLPLVWEGLSRAGVELRGCERTRAVLPGASPADAGDFGREFLDLILACRVVADLDEAVAHIHRYSSNHTESILTGDDAAARAFTERVRSSCVLVNASTRFNDGFSLGLGGEIGISTSRIHAYGPMGLEELTIGRFVARGDYHRR